MESYPESTHRQEPTRAYLVLLLKQGFNDYYAPNDLDALGCYAKTLHG